MPAVNSASTVQKANDTPVKKKLPYPKSVFFIISNEFCERFSYYGMRTILALYLHKSLGYSEDMSTVIYHVFVMLCYFTPLLGGIIADSWLGKYRTIFYVSCIYAVGNIVLAVGSVSTLNISHKAMSLVGLFLIAAGTGGIKPCVSSFGGDQFVMPDQEKQLQSFFSVFYFTINAGSVLSCFFTPMLREQVSCLGNDTCDPLAFGIPAVLMIISVICFVAGKRMYKMKDPEGNIMALVCKCMGHAIVMKSKSKGQKREHWLDYADDKYPKKLIEETKIFLNLAVLFTPTIVFWALYEQQGSRWTFQASHMNGDLGGWYLDPDQIQTLNPVLVLIFIPVFDKLVYPLLAKLRIIRTPLQKLSWGGLLGALAFLISGFLELQLQSSYPMLPHAGESHLRVFNTLSCNLNIKSDGDFLGKDVQVNQLDMLERLALPVVGQKEFSLSASGCDYVLCNLKIKITEREIGNLMIIHKDKQLQIVPLTMSGASEVEKSAKTRVNPKIKVIHEPNIGKNIVISNKNGKLSEDLTAGYSTNITDDLEFGKYSVLVDNQKIGNELELLTGGVYTMMLYANNAGGIDYKLFTITAANSVSMLWQIPQYFVITFAEIMFSITGMEFSFTQSPDSMKSVISALWLITDAFGNIIILIIAGINIFDNKAYEFFLFAALMVVVMAIFIILAMRYKYANISSNDSELKEKIENHQSNQESNQEPNNENHSSIP